MNWQGLKDEDGDGCVLLAYAASISDPAFRQADEPGREVDLLAETRARIRRRWREAQKEIDAGRISGPRPLPMRKERSA